MQKENRVKTFFQENPGKFASKRQASKYLMGFGSVWKMEHNIPMEWGKRTLKENKSMK